ncbi:S1 RNA-binding domain-containing protein 1 [Echinococcus granulosus]|uniref:S1 RNA binding domain containing protein 1 n=1 Tax=Echinococcus granulosus TaxID=6210 RepID=A0A068WZD6_ECHGR|nr:S1 RNA-binding domain-containing protein 1 [Echinococcus granulosus]CDS23032.1 S1 RNA binding domain containing protein 1 [Echinococcus granulosus]
MGTMDVDWDIVNEVATTCGTDRRTTSRVIGLFNSGNTLPFIARYRKEATGNLDPDALRAIRSKLSQCKKVIEKVGHAYTDLSAKGLMTEDLKASLRQCKTTEDVVLITEPFKESAPKSLAARARAAGLEPIACAVFRLGKNVDFGAALVGATAAEVEAGVLNLMAESICKDFDVLRAAEQLCFQVAPTITTTRATQNRSTTSSNFNLEKDLVTFKAFFDFCMAFNRIPPHKVLALNRAEDRKIIRVKMEFPAALIGRIRDVVGQRFLPNIHPAHHKLFWAAFEDGWKRLMKPCLTRKLRSHITSVAQEISLNVFADNLRRILMTAPLRNVPPLSAGDLNAVASSTSSASSREQQQLQQHRLQLSPDVISASLGAPGDRLPVLGLDPGWRHGTKWAACDPLGAVLATGVIHVTLGQDHRNYNSYNGGSNNYNNDEVQSLVRTMRDHGIYTIALGNGQACRQTERWLTQAVSDGLFAPLEVRYAIVNEAGASTYSASPLAASELPALDVALRGAVSIARRLQDPLAEMVKVAPQHLGVGMYQHDLPPRRLQAVVEGAMEECISFVGVDVNTAQLHVLARVAGLSRVKAQEIINYRMRHGRFRCRNELRKVRGIGPSTFAQCAGFLRVKPEYSVAKMDSSRDVEFISLCTDDEEKGTGADQGTDDVEMEVISVSKKRSRLVTMDTSPISKVPRIQPLQPDPDDFSFNPLDQTAIHPASYHVAIALVEHLKYEISDVGCMALRNRAKVLFASSNRDAVLARFTTEEFGLETVRDILDALCRPLDFDEREDRFAPMFRSSVISIANLQPGLEVTGRVDNVTTFGAFVDIGVEETALVPLQHFPPSSSSSTRNIRRSNAVSVGGTCGGGESSILQKLSLRLGDRIKAKVDTVCVKTKRIGLRDVHLLV